MLCQSQLPKEVKDCPNCGGSGIGCKVPKAREPGFIDVKCFMCLGTKVVPAWDYERLKKMVTNEKTVQLEFVL